MELVFVLLIIGVILFILDGIHVVHPNFSWSPLAWACVVAAAAVWIYKTTGVFQ